LINAAAQCPLALYFANAERRRLPPPRGITVALGPDGVIRGYQPRGDEDNW
jgi:hypothetical protein